MQPGRGECVVERMQKGQRERNKKDKEGCRGQEGNEEIVDQAEPGKLMEGKENDGKGKKMDGEV